MQFRMLLDGIRSSLCNLTEDAVRYATGRETQYGFRLFELRSSIATLQATPTPTPTPEDVVQYAIIRETQYGLQVL